jgi:hypothetical protein
MKPASQTQSPQVAAFVGFVLAAVSATLTVITLQYWKVMADALESFPPTRRSGGQAFAVNIPGIALELVSFPFGLSALVALGGALIWRPKIITSGFTIVGLVCLAPIIWIVLRRCGYFAP